MKTNLKTLPIPRAFLNLAAGLGIAAAQDTQASTLWTGPSTNFTQSATNPTDELIPGAVSLTRAFSQWLYNPDAGDKGPAPNTPTDTKWAFGTIDNYQSLSYQTFTSYRDGDLSAVLVGKPMVVHLLNEDIYLSLTFSAWPQNGGFFAYTRSTAAAASPAPTVAITNPVASAVFAAPASLALSATASVASGSVTNVAFFAGVTSLGTVQSDPFKLTVSNLPAGAYPLSAIATAAGISATSAVVNIIVVSPIAVSVSQATVSNGQFAFNYSANPGLDYLVQTSSNLINWLPFVTNTATANPMGFTNSFSSTGTFYYRVGLLPKP